MKIAKLLLLIFVWSLCAPAAFAQKQLKYVPQAVKGTKTIPYVVNPKLPPATRTHFAMPVVRPTVPQERPTVAPAVERAVTAQVAAQTAPRVPVAPSNLQKDILTGVQALQKFRPGWKSELMLSGFTRQQLDLVEQAFKETDQFLFETDEEGNWLKPRFAEWNYLARYTKILTDNAYGELSLNDGQIKTLFGKFSRLDDVFTRLNLQAFLLVHKRAPNTNAPGEEGKLARHAKYNLDKRDGRKMNPEVEGYVYGNKDVHIAQSVETETIELPQTAQSTADIPAIPGLKPMSYYYPAWKQELGAFFSSDELETIEKAFAATEDWIFVRGEDGELDVRNPDEWDYESRFFTILTENNTHFTDADIKQLTGGKGSRGFTFNHYFALKNTLAFIMSTKKRPRMQIREEGRSLSVAELKKRAQAGDSQADKLARELEVGQKINKSSKWTQDPIYPDLKALLTNEAYLNIAVAKTPQEWLDIIEPWVLKYKRWPSWISEDERQMSAGADRTLRNHPTHPASLRLRTLKEQYGPNNQSPKTPQEWLEIIEPWVLKYKRWPSNNIPEETQMYKGAFHAIEENPDNPASKQLQQLKQTYGPNREKNAPRKTPQEWAEIIEPWVIEHKRWPLKYIEEEKQMYIGAANIMHRYPEDPASVRMRELKEKYP